MEFIFTFIDIKTKLANDHHFLFFVVVFFFSRGLEQDTLRGLF